jgi:hypothetical protein
MAKWGKSKPLYERIPNSVPPPEGAAWIPLTKGKYALVDQEDFARVNYLCHWTWHTAGYAYGSMSKTRHLLHRIVVNAKLGQHVDHINGNKLDCRKANLRICTVSQNQANRKISANNTSGYKGIVNHKRGPKCWQARITVDQKAISLGYYADPKDAARAYNEAAKKYFGEFAKLNVIED